MDATFRLAMVTWLSVAVSSAPAGAGIAGEQGLSGPRPRSRPGDVPGSRDSRGAGHQLSTVTSTGHAGEPTPVWERDKAGDQHTRARDTPTSIAGRAPPGAGPAYASTGIYQGTSIAGRKPTRGSSLSRRTGQPYPGRTEGTGGRRLLSREFT